MSRSWDSKLVGPDLKRDDWLSLDRAIDVLALQDVLAWDRELAWLLIDYASASREPNQVK